MKTIHLVIAISLTMCAFAADDFVSLFDGKTLNGWEGRSEFWSVKDGAIVGQSTKETPVQENTFLICKAGEFGDFELRVQFKLVANNEKGWANSGIQYRSKVVKPEYCVVAGYQADIEAGKNFTGILYEEKGRGILARRGEKVVIKDSDNPKKPKIENVGSVGDPDAIQAAVRPGDWNDYVIIAKGNRLQQFINGKQTVDVTDDSAVAAKSGIIALQLHKGEPMTVYFRHIKIKKL